MDPGLCKEFHVLINTIRWPSTLGLCLFQWDTLHMSGC